MSIVQVFYLVAATLFALKGANVQAPVDFGYFGWMVLALSLLL